MVVAFQNTFVFRLAQFIDTRALLCQQLAAVDSRFAVRQTIERIASLMLRQLCAANHDLGGDAAYVHTRATDDIGAFYQGDRCTALHCPGSGSKRAGAGTNDNDVRSPVATAVDRLPIATEQFSAVALAGQCVEQERDRHIRFRVDLSGAFCVGHAGGNAGYLIQRALRRHRAMVTGHAGDAQRQCRHNIIRPGRLASGAGR